MTESIFINIINVIIINFIIAFGFVSTSILAKKVGFEIARKYIHAFTVFIGILLLIFFDLKSKYIFIIFILSLLQLFYIKKSNFEVSKILNAKTRKTYGDIALVLGIAFLWFSAKNDIMYLSLLLIVGISDSLAAIIPSIVYKNNPNKLLKKTELGSFSFFIATFIILLLINLLYLNILPILIIRIFITSLLLTFVERFSYYGLDNFLIILIGEILLWI